MTVTSEQTSRSLKYHQNAYQFVFQALQFTQERLERLRETDDADDRDAHISGKELLHGIRDLAQEQFGLLANSVFNRWGIRETEDFGRIVFELVDRGEMRKTEHDRLSDFYDVFDFEEVFGRGYTIDTSQAFK